MISYEDAATEIFQIIRSYDYTATMYDDDGNQVYEPDQTRRFFVRPKNLLVSLVDDGDDSSVRLYLSKSTKAKDIVGFITALRITATKYNMVLNVRETGRDLKPSDFSTRSSVSENREVKMNILEGMYGTSRSSYLKLENARLIVRHSKRINEYAIGARGRHIDAIFVENAQGERMLFPTRDIMPARAEVQHINQGGTFHDALSQQIMRMANDFSNLNFASGQIATQAPVLGESALQIRETIRSRVMEMKKSFSRLSKPSSYVKESAALSLTTLNEHKEEAVDITEVKKALTCKGFELAEAVLISIAEALNSSPMVEDEGDEHDLEGRGENVLSWSKNGQSGKEYFEDKKDMMDHAKDLMASGHKVSMADKNGNPIVDKRATDDVVMVCGKKVNKAAWEEFVAGRLELIGNPSDEMVDPDGKGAGKPQFLNKDAEMAYLLGQIIPQVKDDSMLNLLSFVDQQMNSSRVDPEMRKKMKTIAKFAIKYAGLSLSEDLAFNHPVIREFNEWLGKFSPSVVLNEGWDDHQRDTTEAAKSAITRRIMSQRHDLLSKFGPSKVMAAIDDQSYLLHNLQEIGSSDISAWVRNIEDHLNRGSYDHVTDENFENEGEVVESYDDDETESRTENPNYDSLDDEEKVEKAVDEAIADFDPNDFFNYYKDEIFWNNGSFDMDGVTDEERTMEKSYLKGMVDHYLEKQVQNLIGYDVSMDDYNIEDLLDDVESKMTEAGFELTGSDVTEDMTFSKIDLVIPTNQGEDFEREVTKATSVDPYTGEECPVDDSYVERMRTLAGMPWNR